MDLLISIVVGGATGVLAAILLYRSGFGLLGDFLFGIVGASLGSWSFQLLGWEAPFAGVVAVAAIGAVVLLAGIRSSSRLMSRS